MALEKHPMFSLQRLLSKGDRFFDLLEGSAQEAQESVRALLKLIATPGGQQAFDEFAHRWRQDKQITEEISALLCSSFVTPLEREDIEALSHALSRIPKTIKKFAERLRLFHSALSLDCFIEQTKLLEQATDTVHKLVCQLRHGTNLDQIRELNNKLHAYEGAADKLILILLQDLYSGQHEALKMIVLRDLYELLEKVIDRCRDAGNVILQIALKIA
jgi:uncharacterized protein Yka (UPF0111/DUF47 family)